MLSEPSRSPTARSSLASVVEVADERLRLARSPVGNGRARRLGCEGAVAGAVPDRDGRTCVEVRRLRGRGRRRCRSRRPRRTPGPVAGGQRRARRLGREGAVAGAKADGDGVGASRFASREVHGRRRMLKSPIATGPSARRPRANGEPAGAVAKCAVAGAEADGDVVGRLVCRRQVFVAVVIEVANGDVVGSERGCERRPRWLGREGPIPSA